MFGGSMISVLASELGILSARVAALESQAVAGKPAGKVIGDAGTWFGCRLADGDDNTSLEAAKAKAFNDGYLAGFRASGEGWNGEYGCDLPEADQDWVGLRDIARKELL